MGNGNETARRSTRQRRIVLEELRQVVSHPTAGELHEMARRRLPKISIGTVYRNLDLLAQMGTITKLEMGGPEARFDGDTSQHHHIRCTECGRVDDARGLGDEPSMSEMIGPDGYEVLGYRLELIGICPQCRNRVTSPAVVGQRPDVDWNEVNGACEPRGARVPTTGRFTKGGHKDADREDPEGAE